VNAAVFYNDYSDKQVRTQVLRNDQLNPIVTNASSAEVTGTELDINWLPDFLEGLSLRAAYTWQDPEYTDFVEPTTAPQRIAAAYYVNPSNDCTTVVQSTTSTSVACQIDLSGNQLERAARNAFYFSADLDRPINGDLEWFVHGDASFTDKRYYEADNVEYWDDVWIFNANAGLTGGRWEAQIYVNNILDDDTIQTGFRGPDFGKQVTLLGFTGGLGANSVYALLPDPRVIGVRASYRFGAAL
jgi:outer membrane receptor protein involved in Fe transport